MDEKPELIIFSQNKLGGVQNYFFNLIKYDEENIFDKFWIFSDHIEDTDAKLPQPYNICREELFQHGNENIYSTTSRLNKFISNKSGLILTNHEIELITLHKNRKKNKTIFFFVHDECYVSTAVKYEFLIDVFIVHNIQYYYELKKLLPEKRASNIYYLPYGIEIHKTKSKFLNVNDPLKLIFIARLHQKKGVYDLLKIHEGLTKKKIAFSLTIIGDGPEKDELEKLTKNHKNINLYQLNTTDDVLKVATTHDIYILPSFLDGIPVALLEAMSVGLVPIIYKFNEGIKEVVKKDNGYIVPSGNFEEIQKIIENLDKNRLKLTELSKNAKKHIIQNYNAEVQFKAYYALFKQFEKLRRKPRRKHIQYDGRLDYPFIPQFLRDGYKALKSIIKNIIRVINSDKKF